MKFAVKPKTTLGNQTRVESKSKVTGVINTIQNFETIFKIMNGFNTHETDDLGSSQGSNVPILSRAEIVLSTKRTNIVINPLPLNCYEVNEMRSSAAVSMRTTSRS